MIRFSVPYLLLLHELRVGAVVHDIASKHRRSQNSVDLLGVDVLELAIEDKVVSVGTNSDSGLLSKQNEGEDISVLKTMLATLLNNLIARSLILNPPWRGSS